MVDITRGNVLLNLAAKLGLQSAAGGVPSKIKDDVQPTYELNPREAFVVRQATGSTTATINIYTTPNDERFFYLTNLHFAFTKDANSDMIAPYIRFYVDGDGAYRDIIYPCQTTTAESRAFDIVFPFPIKLQKNTIISCVGAFAAGTARKDITVVGFLDY